MPGGIRLVTAHALAVLAGSVRVFLALAGAQGVLTAVLPAGVFRRVSAALQTLAVVGLLSMLLGFSALAERFAYGSASALLLGRPFVFVTFVAGTASLSAILASRRRRLVRRLGLSFEDPPDTPSMGLDD